MAVPALDRASTDDKRISERIIQVFQNSYSIQIKYGVLNRNYSTSKLMPLSDNIDLNIPNPPPHRNSDSTSCGRPKNLLLKRFLCTVAAETSEHDVQHDGVLASKPISYAPLHATVVRGIRTISQTVQINRTWLLGGNE